MGVKGNKRADLAWMRKLAPVKNWKGFEEVFNDAQADLEPIVQRTGRKLYTNEMGELAIRLAQITDDEQKKRIRMGIYSTHRSFLTDYDKYARIRLEEPGGKRLYAFKECCKWLKKWVWNANIYQGKAKK